MSEWTVVTVITVLVGLMVSVIKPVLKLNASLTRLNESVDSLEKNIAGLNNRNSESHDKLWKRSDEHNLRLSQHETRVQILEKSKN